MWRTTLLLISSLLLLPGCREADPPLLAVSATATFGNAGRLAVRDALLDGPLPPFDTIFRSDQSNRADPAVEMAAELVTVPGLLAVVGHSNSTASLAASQIYNSHQVVQIAPTSTAPLYSEAGPFSFRMVPPDDVQGRYLAELLAEELPEGAPVALLYVNDDYGRGFRRSLLEWLDLDRFPVVVDLPHLQEDVEAVVRTRPPGDPGRERVGRADFDVQHAASAVEVAEAGALVWLGRPEGLNHLLPALRARGVLVPVFGGDALSRHEHMEDRVPEWSGVRYLDFLDMGASAELRAFQQRYTEMFGEPAGAPEALTYDAARVVLEALREGAASGRELRAYLSELGRTRPPFPGVTGPVSFTPSGDVQRGYVAVTVE